MNQPAPFLQFVIDHRLANDHASQQIGLVVREFGEGPGIALTVSRIAFQIGRAIQVGDYDVVKAVLSQIADMRWMQIAIKPAKPFAFGLLASAGGRSVTNSRVAARLPCPVSQLRPRRPRPAV